MPTEKTQGNEPILCPPEAGPVELERCPSFAASKDFAISDFHPQENVVGSSYTLKPGEKVPVTYKISPKHLQFGNQQQFQPEVVAGTLIKLKVSTRSFRAQSGVFVYLDENKPLTPEQVEALAKGEELGVAGYLENIGQSAQVLEQGDDVGRFYWTNDEERLHGADLKKLLDNGLVGPQNWHLINDYTVAVKVSADRFLVPNMPDDQPHRFDKRQEFGHFSGYTAPHGQALETAGLVDSQHPFHLLVTQEKLNLPDNVMGVLLPETDLPGVIHYPSLLIDPGSNWPVRLEVRGGHPQFVYFTFYKTDNCPARPAADIANFNVYAAKK